MLTKDFDKIVHERIVKIESVLQCKAKEYSSEKNRLHNFKRAAAMLNQTPEKSLIGMFVKHMVSILDIVDAIPEIVLTPEMINEKISDAINYLILLEGLLAERIDEEAEIFDEIAKETYKHIINTTQNINKKAKK